MTAADDSYYIVGLIVIFVTVPITLIAVPAAVQMLAGDRVAWDWLLASGLPWVYVFFDILSILFLWAGSVFE